MSSYSSNYKFVYLYLLQNDILADTQASFKIHRGSLTKGSSPAAGSAAIGIIITVTILLFAGMAYLYLKRRNTGEFNVRYLNYLIFNLLKHIFNYFLLYISA